MQYIVYWAPQSSDLGSTKAPSTGPANP